MVPVKLLRYYLPLYTDSVFPPHGRSTMYSMPLFYLLIAKLKCMVPPSPDLPLT